MSNTANKPARLCGPASKSFDAKLAATRKLLEDSAALPLTAPGHTVLASSLGAEDMVLLDIIASSGFNISAFVIDTGRLHLETQQLLSTALARYKVPLAVFSPKAESVESYVGMYGVDAFYNSIELRKACCAMRKTEPLVRALAGKTAWITGLRRSQSLTRHDLSAKEWDATHGLWKFNPLLDWTEGDVWHYIDSRAVPYNPLHDAFYPSIGCAPCTRAISPGEDVRAGRWWWEDPQNKECGLHVASSAIPIKPIATHEATQP
jgi:phosphoadenosine phosphosulfate reductase